MKKIRFPTALEQSLFRKSLPQSVKKIVSNPVRLPVSLGP